MKKTVWLALLLLSMGTAWPQAVNKKILILPFENTTTETGFASSVAENARDLLFNGIFSFVGLLPFVDIPQSAELKRFSSADIPALARSQSADLIIYGQLELSGAQDNPQAQLVLRVWSKDKGEDIFTRRYTSATDLDIFDTLDRMIVDTLTAAFRITPRFAVIQFSNFEIIGESYSLYVNNKLIAKVNDSSFNLTLKVLAENKYNLMLIRERDQAIVYTHSYTLKQNSIATVSYAGAGSVRIDALRGTDPGQTYQVLLNGEAVTPGQEVKSLPLTMKHTVIVVAEPDKRILYRQEFSLKDGELRILNPDVTGRRLYLRAFALGNSFGGVGVDLILNRKLWLGWDTGYSLANNTNLNVSVSVISTYLDAGYYLIGQNSSEFKVSLSLGGGGYFAFPLNRWQQISTRPNFALAARSYVQAEWHYIYLRAGLLIDFLNGVQASPLVSIGYRF